MWLFFLWGVLQLHGGESSFLSCPRHLPLSTELESSLPCSRISLLNFILRQLYALYTLISCSFKIYFNIIVTFFMAVFSLKKIVKHLSILSLCSMFILRGINTELILKWLQHSLWRSRFCVIYCKFLVIS